MNMRNEKGQFVKGHRYNIGVKRSKETKEKIRKAHKGKALRGRGWKLSEDVKDKIRQGHLKRGLFVIKNCLYCNKEFRVPKCREKAKFCSCKCRAKLIMPSGQSRIGRIPWNKGLTKKDDIRINNIGFQKGEKNPSWNNGSSSFKDKHKKEWKVWREKVFERDDWTCQKYRTKGGILHPHHIKNFNEHSELRFELDNGITLSEKAHKEFHGIYGTKNNTREQLNEFLNNKNL